MRPQLPTVIALASALLAGSAAASPADDGADYEIIPLTGLTPRTFGVAAINDSTEVAGMIFPDAGEPARVFVWRDGTVASRDLPGPGASVLGMNENGVVVGVAEGTDAPVVFVWDSRTDAYAIVPATLSVWPADVNEDLLIAGADREFLHGVALDGVTGAHQTIAFGDIPEERVGTPGALAVNRAGVVVGAEVIFLPDEGFYQETPYTWTETGGIVSLPTLDPGFGGRAIDVNVHGSIAGIVFDDSAGMQTALWPAGLDEVRNLGSPFNFFVSEATAINARDEIAVLAPNDLFGYTRAFVWRDGAFIDLSSFAPPDRFTIRPVDLNDSGEILVQLSDEIGRTILDIVIMRPVGVAPDADLDNDGDVDFQDLLLLLGAWGPCDPVCPEDLDHDGAVTFADLLLLLSGWTSAPAPA